MPLSTATAFTQAASGYFGLTSSAPPIVVLSNNDGCVIARSADAKPFVKMGALFHEIRGDPKHQGVVAFSSNYALYGDMSERVMSIIEARLPAVEVYSIDKSKLYSADA